MRGVQRLLVERDDRIFVLPQRGLVVMAPPAYATALLGRRAGAAVDAGPQRPPELRWKELVASIDAEDGAMPDDAILMMTASQLVGGRRRGGGPELPATGPNGLPLPQYLTLFAGAPAGAFLELIGQFERDADAASWITAWPGWKQTLLGSPLLLLSGFSPIVARADMRQEDNAVILRTTGSGIELRRVLGTIGNLIGGGRR